ncbi:MAG TPA: DUF6350 family protein [Ornithinibacter sp.]|nr:DUF6350 family protein [Ornithinibacter sp.]
MTVVDRLRSAFPGSTDPGDDAEPTDGSTPDTIETAEPAPWWRAAVVGLVTGLASLLVVLAPVVLAWLTDPIDGSTLWQAVGTGAAFWLLSSGAHLSVGPIALSLVPLLALALLVIVARRGAREALAEVTTEGEHWHGLLPAPLATALGAWWGGYAVAVAAAVGLSIPGAFSVSALSLALPLVLVPLLSAALAVRPLVRDEPDVLGPVLDQDRVPDLVRRGIRPGMAGVRALFAVAAVVVLSAVALSWGEVSTISAEVGAAGVGSVVLALAQLAYLPNIAVWVISFLAGPGFQVVEGGAVTWSGSEGGLLPMVPVLAALPQPGAFPWFVALSVLLVVGVGSFIGRRALREVARLSRLRTKAAAALSACAVTAVVVVALDLVAGGAAGQFRLSAVGAPDLSLFVALFLELSLGALVAVLRDAWTLRR